MQMYNLILVYNNDCNRILMCHRSKDPYKGLYNLVGGKIEPGETDLASAYRELFEETGISSDTITLKHLMDFVYPLDDCGVKVYVGKLMHDADLVEEEHTLHWIDVNDNNFFDVNRFAGEGNIGHIIEHTKLNRTYLFE